MNRMNQFYHDLMRSMDKCMEIKIAGVDLEAKFKEYLNVLRVVKLKSLSYHYCIGHPTSIKADIVKSIIANLTNFDLKVMHEFRRNLGIRYASQDTSPVDFSIPGPNIPDRPLEPWELSDIVMIQGVVDAAKAGMEFAIEECVRESGKLAHDENLLQRLINSSRTDMIGSLNISVARHRLKLAEYSRTLWERNYYSAVALLNRARERNNIPPDAVINGPVVERNTIYQNHLEEGRLSAGGEVNVRRFVKLSDLKMLQFDPRTYAGNWIQQLRSYGLVVLPIGNFDYRGIKDRLWTWLESANNGINRSQPSTWIQSSVPTSYGGLISSYIGHEEFMWNTREACYPIFSGLWGTSELLSSFDGASVMFRPRSVSESFKEYYHTNQSPDDREFSSVEGIVYLEDSGPNDGGFSYIERSHLVFDTYMNNNPNHDRKYGNVNIENPLYKQYRKIKLCVRAGHIVLFDSRLVHHTLNTLDRPILTINVSMGPQRVASGDDLNKRLFWYNHNRMTNHYTSGPHMKCRGKLLYVKDVGRYPNPPPATILTPYSQLSNLRRGLVGEYRR